MAEIRIQSKNALKALINYLLYFVQQEREGFLREMLAAVTLCVLAFPPKAESREGRPECDAREGGLAASRGAVSRPEYV